MRISFAVALALALVACGEPTADRLTKPFDAGGDALADASIEDAQTDADPNLGGPCLDDTQCNDQLDCTFDTCDTALKRCKNIPDDARCDDGFFCNGREECVRGLGCREGAVVTCNDNDTCSIDRCDEASKSCTHVPRDADGDGDPDGHCVVNHDCNDFDPTVASTHSEVCGNGKDDDCDGQSDETGCVTVTGDTCATAGTLGGPGTYIVPTAGANRDLASSCGVTNAGAAKDVVYAFDVLAGGPADASFWITGANAEVAVAVFQNCGDSASEVACGASFGGMQTRAIARSLPPGRYFVVVTSQGETSAQLRFDLEAPTSRPANESCASATVIATDTAIPVSLVDPVSDLPTLCTGGLGELAYRFDLPTPRDVRIFASPVLGSGVPVVSLRTAACANAGDEIKCGVIRSTPLSARSLAAGTYYVTVSASAPMDLSLLVQTSAPTPTDPNADCATAPAINANETTALSLADHDGAIRDGCFPTSSSAAYQLVLPAVSDLLAIGRFPRNDPGAVSLNPSTCTAVTRIACSNGNSPVRLSRRGLAAGDYRLVIAEGVGGNVSLTPLLRNALPPTAVTGADDCASAYALPSAGGYFTGDTNAVAANFGNPCDSQTSPQLGAADQIFRLVLNDHKRVVLSTAGSDFQTILDVRRGPACPGTPVANACFVGFSSDRSFLDLELDAGTYFVIVDGYAENHGTWALDVWVVP